MSTLTNTQIRNTYDSLLKLADNGNLTTVLKEITDGLGNITPLSISQIAVKSSVDLEASGFKTPTGTSSQFLKADGSIGDLTNYDNAYTHSQSAHAPANAEQNVQSDWDSITGDSLILNKPTIPSGNQIIDWTGASAGTIHITNLPATAITSVQIASTQVAMLALTTQEGDVVVRSDENKTYMHNGGTAGTIADFTELATPTSDVTSVDGATGAIVLNHDSLAGFVSNEHIDWTVDNGATNINAGNYTDTTYTNVSEFINDAGYTGDQDLSGYLLNTTDTFTGTLTVEGDVALTTALLSYINGSSLALQRMDTRIDATNYSRMHWYGNNDTGGTSNYRSAWYDGSGYINITAASGTATFGGNLAATNLSGTNTGDQDLSSYITTATADGKYLLNTSDTLTGTLIIDGGTGVSSTGVLQVRQKGDTVADGIAITSSHGTSHRIWKDVSGNLNLTKSDGTGAVIDLSGNISATNLSGTNTGDQDLSSFITTSTADGKYLLNTTDTLNGDLTVTGDTTFGGNVGIGTTTFPTTAIGDKNLLVQGAIITKPPGVDDYYSYLKSNWAADGAFELGIQGADVNHKLITTSGYYHGTHLNFWTSDQKRMVIDTNGNVGIGTTSPIGKLYVGPTWDTSAGGNALYIKSTTTDNDSYDPQVVATTNLGITMVTDSATTTGPDTVGLTLYNDDGTAGGFSPMLLFSKLEAPTSQYKASMAGIYARSPLGTGNSNSWIDGELIFATAGAASQGIKQRMVINKEGNVGIGTTSPDALLDIEGAVYSTLRMSSAHTYSSNRNWDWITNAFGAGNWGGIALRTSTAAGGSPTNVRFGIDYLGNVGIGTTSPAAKLDIGAAVNVAPNLRLTLTDSGNSINAGQEYGGIQWKGNDGQGDGVRADIRVFGEHTSGETYMTFGTMTAGTSASTNAVERMRITSDGLVTLASMSSNDTRQLTFMGDSNSTSGNGGAIGMFSNASRFTSNYYYKGGQRKYVAGNGQAAVTLHTGTTDANTYMSFGVNPPSDAAGITERMRITSAGNVLIRGNSDGNDVILNLDNNKYGSTDTSGQTKIMFGWLNHKAANIAAYKDGTVNRTGFIFNTEVGYNTESEVMRITSAGNVGIGTDSPDSKLDVKGPSASPADGNQTLSITNTTGGTQLNLGTAENSYGWIEAREGATLRNLLLQPNGGNVGIGISTPTAKLHVSGGGILGSNSTNPIAFTGSSGINAGIGSYNANTDFNLYSAGTGNVKIRTGAVWNTSGQLTNTGTERMRINSSGNVGIGTDTPLAKLHLESDGSTGFRIQRADGAATSGYLAIASEASHNTIYSRNTDGNTAKKIRIVQGSTETLSILANGKVGIGESNPSALLHVRAATDVTGTIEVQGGKATVTSVGEINAELNFGSNDASATGGIGGSIKSVTEYDNGAYVGMSFYTTKQGRTPVLKEAMRINHDGNVGIGTDNPVTKLHIEGTSGSIYVQSTTANQNASVYFNSKVGTNQSLRWEIGTNIANGADFEIFDRVASQTRFLVETTTGNVGIGDTTPSYKLDVNGTIRATGDIIAYSDVRVKKNIKTIDNALDKVKALRGVYFERKDNGAHSTGVIAQEIEKILPEVVATDNEGMKAVAYGNIVGVLIEAIKEQDQQLDFFALQFEAMQKQINDITYKLKN